MNSKSLIYRVVFFIITLFSIGSNSQNLLINGDFESGGNGVGFNINGAGYSEILPPFSGNTSPGNYAFTNNPQPMNTGFFIAGGDHTTGESPSWLRHRILIPACEGSNPSSPAIFK